MKNILVFNVLIEHGLYVMIPNHFVYCSGPGSCQELFNNLHENLPAVSFGLYHGELDGEQRKIAIKDWKMVLLKL